MGQVGIEFRSAGRAAVLCALLGVASAAFADMPGGHNELAPNAPPISRPEPKILNQVGIDQHLNAQLPMDVPFRDEQGHAVTLKDVIGKNGRPAILALVYYKCPMLCTMVLNDVIRSLSVINLNAGKDFDVVAVSFDPREGPELSAAKKAEYVRHYHRPGGEAGWHFLTGTQESIKAITETVGFRYVYDPKFDQYAHASGITVITPDGRISKYFYGIDYEPTDLRLALVEAAGGKIGGPVEAFLLYCFHYDPSTGRYSLAIANVLKVAGAATVLGLGGMIALFLKKEHSAAAGMVNVSEKDQGA